MNLYLIFHEKYFGSAYGVGTYIRELILALKDSKISICVISLISNKSQILKEEINGIKYWHIPIAISYEQTQQEQQKLYDHNIVYLLQLYIKKKENIVFHLNFPHSDHFIENFKKAFYCKIVSVVHYLDWGSILFDNLKQLRNILNEEDSDSPNKYIKKRIKEEKSYYSKADHCICLTKYMQEIMYRDYQLDITKISIIPNGLHDMTDSSTNIKNLRKKWNISSNDKILLFVGRMDEIKGVAYLMKAFQTVLNIYPQSKLILAGNGKYSKYIQNSQNICTKVVYTGHLDTTQLCEWYRLANIGIIPSLFEPFGLVAVEMMMHELPIVATATSGLNEVVDESCGLKVPLSVTDDKVEIDTSLLAEKIVYLLQNPEEAKQLGKNGRKRYLEKYSSEVFRKNMLAFYNSLWS